MGKLILIVGGARSGKSRFAQQLADRISDRNVLFVATAEARDEEMIDRIRMHRRTRPESWTTLERTEKLATAPELLSPEHDVLLIDCLTLLVSNLLLSFHEPQNPDLVQAAVNEEIERLLSVCQHRTGTVIVVSGEVGMGLVPEYPLGRLYRDLLGWANQHVADRADATYMMIAGLAVEVKSLATSLEQAAEKFGEECDE